MEFEGNRNETQQILDSRVNRSERSQSQIFNESLEKGKIEDAILKTLFSVRPRYQAVHLSLQKDTRENSSTDFDSR